MKKKNLEIIHCITGTETIDKCRRNPDIKVILLDIKLPELSGFEVTRKIREFNNNVHIIAQTAFTEFHNMKKAIESGCDDYMPKPINGQDLINKIDNVLEIQ